MILKDIMTEEVECVRTGDTAQQAAQLMETHDVGSLPVCEDGRVVGIVTDRDIALRFVAHGGRADSKVGDVMTRDPVFGQPDMDVHEAAKIMSEQQIRRLPVVEGGSLVGIVSLGDMSVQPELQDNAEWALQNISRPCRCK